MPGDRRIVLLLLAAGAAALVLIGRLVLPSVQAAPETIVPAPLAVSAASVQTEPRGPVLVHVAGAVRRPGVYRLRDGARVRDALRAAGGAVRGALLEAVNLAARLVDGEQVLVPARAAAGATAAVPVEGRPATIHLSSATAEQLDGLDGIGPAIAARIVDYRSEHGAFRSVDELGEVPGIGPARLEALREHVAP